jgi:copper chaperone
LTLPRWQALAWCSDKPSKDGAVLELTINTMTCQHCVGAVTQTIRDLDPQAQVAIDLTSHRVSVESAASRERIVAVLADAGYAPDR